METTTSSTPEKILIATDQMQIDSQTKAINNTLPLMQAIYAAYNALLPQVPELDTNTFKTIFFDLDGFIEGLKVYWYQQNFAEKHQQMGISQNKGMELVSDQVLNYDIFDNRVMDYQNVTSYDNNGNWRNYSSVDAFEIVDNAVVISDTYLAQIQENAKFYLQYEQEFALQETLQVLSDNFNKLYELVPKHLLNIHHNIDFNRVPDFNVLNQVYQVIYPRLNTDAPNPVYNIKTDFYRQFKIYLLQSGLV